jgi:hypothetical protein
MQYVYVGTHASPCFMSGRGGRDGMVMVMEWFEVDVGGGRRKEEEEEEQRAIVFPKRVTDGRMDGGKRDG